MTSFKFFTLGYLSEQSPRMTWKRVLPKILERWHVPKMKSVIILSEYHHSHCVVENFGHFLQSGGTFYPCPRKKSFWIWFIYTPEGHVRVWTNLFLKKVFLWNTLVLIVCTLLESPGISIMPNECPFHLWNFNLFNSKVPTSLKLFRSDIFAMANSQPHWGCLFPFLLSLFQDYLLLS